jgi:hypothetical protein
MAENVVPGVFGIARPVLVLPRTQWASDQLQIVNLEW